MNIKGKSAVITGAGSGIGQAVAIELAERGIGAVGLVDRSDNVINVARIINDRMDRPLAEAIIGDVTDADFRAEGVRPDVQQVRGAGGLRPRRGHHPRPARRQDGQADRQGVDLPDRELPPGHGGQPRGPRLLGLEMVARIAEERLHKGKGRWAAEEGIQGTVIFIGSISSSGIPGQVSYSATKAALEGVAATLGKEATYHGVRFATIHPGFTDTPMVRALGQEYIEKNIIPTPSSSG